MNKEDLEYERKYSHSHCWNQGKSPACGQPLKNHKQCCLCDTVYKPRKRFPSQPNSEDGKMMYGHSSGNEVQFSHSPKPEEKCPLGKGHKYSEICRVCTPLPDTTEEKCCEKCAEWSRSGSERYPDCKSILCPCHSKDSIQGGVKVVIDNSPYGQLKSMLGAFNLDLMKPVLDELVSQIQKEERERIIERIKEMRLHLGYKNNILELLDELGLKDNKKVKKLKKYSDCPCCGECCDNPKIFTPEHTCTEDFCEDCYCLECSNCGKAGCHEL